MSQSGAELEEYVKSGIVEEFEFSDEEEEAYEPNKPPAPSLDGPRLARVLSHRDSMDGASFPMDLDAAELVPAGEEGMVWHAQIRADSFADPKHIVASGELKPRRPIPQIRVSHFFQALVQAKDGRWLFGGPLNGWPALRSLELRSITAKGREKLVAIKGVKRLYDAASKEGQVPQTEQQLAELNQLLGKSSVRVTLRAPAWTDRGFAQDQPGYVLWFDSQGPRGPRVLHGTGIIAALRAEGNAAQMKAVHLFGHRYASVRESMKDRLTYHSALLLEWDHGHHCSVIELAWLNGLGGYGGKSNFVADRDCGRPELYKAFPADMKAPWVPSRSEIRVLDVPARNKAEFEAFLQEHTGTRKRFLEPSVPHSAAVELSHRSQADLFRYLINYIARNPRYVQESRNCQTFAADLFRILTGRQNVDPFHPVIKPFYKPRPLDFLYATAGFE